MSLILMKRRENGEKTKNIKEVANSHTFVNIFIRLEKLAKTQDTMLTRSRLFLKAIFVHHTSMQMCIANVILDEKLNKNC